MPRCDDLSICRPIQEVGVCANTQRGRPSEQIRGQNKQGRKEARKRTSSRQRPEAGGYTKIESMGAGVLLEVSGSRSLVLKEWRYFKRNTHVKPSGHDDMPRRHAC